MQAMTYHREVWNPTLITILSGFFQVFTLSALLSFIKMTTGKKEQLMMVINLFLNVEKVLMTGRYEVQVTADKSRPHLNRDAA